MIRCKSCNASSLTTESWCENERGQLEYYTEISVTATNHDCCTIPCDNRARNKHTGEAILIVLSPGIGINASERVISASYCVILLYWYHRLFMKARTSGSVSWCVKDVNSVNIVFLFNPYSFSVILSMTSVGTTAKVPSVPNSFCICSMLNPLTSRSLASLQIYVLCSSSSEPAFSSFLL